MKESLKEFFKKKYVIWSLPLVALLLVLGGIYIASSFIVPDKTRPVTIKEYDDVRITDGKSVSSGKDVSRADLSKQGDIITTLWFNKNTVWPQASKMPPGSSPEKILEDAINPGLGIRELHSQGITGTGVNVAIIDQPMYTDHPEFAGKIAAYKDMDSQMEESMLGPAVASFLVGENIGTAPGAKLYYAAVPSWKKDSAYYAAALKWIIDENKKLPDGQKIRVVSVSAAPSGNNSPFTTNTKMWEDANALAQKEGILVLDCTEQRGLIAPSWLDASDPENVSKCKPGLPGVPWGGDVPENKIFVPTSPRTSAEEYKKGDFGYQYTGRGGLSWAVPYAAGVLALGWQVRPELTNKQAVDLLFKSAYVVNGKFRFIDPKGFIKLVKEFKP